MTQFEFVLVLLSLIVGIALADLLSSVSRQLRDRELWKFSWLQSGVAVFIFVALLQQWWESWGLQGVEQWNFANVLLMLAGPVGLYIAAHLLYPRGQRSVDLEEHYFENARVFWMVAAVVVVVATLFRPISFGMPLFDLDNAASVVLFATFLTLALVGKRVVHKIVFPIVFVTLLADIFVFNPNI